MLKVFKNIEQYDESKGTLFNWVYTIVRHAAISHFKQQKVNLTYELNDRLKDTWESNPFIHLEWKDIYVYLDQLPKTTRTVCALFYLQGFAINEIASALEIKEGTVKWHLNESRTKLKVLFNQEKVQIRG
jgi:RNA polymerase sigma-70 factor (ECF subfamily)